MIVLKKEAKKFHVKLILIFNHFYNLKINLKQRVIQIKSLHLSKSQNKSICIHHSKQLLSQTSQQKIDKIKIIKN